MTCETVLNNRSRSVLVSELILHDMSQHSFRLYASSSSSAVVSPLLDEGLLQLTPMRTVLSGLYPPLPTWPSDVIYLILGLPGFLSDLGFHTVKSTAQLSCILATCPAHFHLLLKIVSMRHEVRELGFIFDVLVCDMVLPFHS